MYGRKYRFLNDKDTKAKAAQKEIFVSHIAFVVQKINNFSFHV
jgi:hypothetical protein